MAEGTLDLEEMVLIDYTVSKFRGGPIKTKVERGLDNNKAKYLQNGKK